MSFVTDPTSSNREPLRRDNGEYFDGIDTIPVIRDIVTRVKRDAQKMGHDLSAVVVVNRKNGVMRAWNMSRNATTYALALTGDYWRFATQEESLKWQEETKKERIEVARKKLRVHEAAVDHLEKQQHFENLVNTALTDDSDMKEFTADDIATLGKRLAAAKASLPKAKAPPKDK